MAQQIQQLIDQIKSEGIDQAQQQALTIENDAKVRAAQIIKDAEGQADNIVAKAQAQAKQIQESASTALKQVGRDSVLNVRREITSLLNQTITKHLQNTLTPEATRVIIENLLKDLSAKGANAQLTLSPSDLSVLREGVLAKWQEALKNGIVVKASESVNKGLLISFDHGKSAFDFTDSGLTEYIASLLNEELANILRG